MRASDCAALLPETDDNTGLQRHAERRISTNTMNVRMTFYK